MPSQTSVGSSGANFASTFVAITDSFQKQKASMKELELKEQALDLEARKQEREQMQFDLQVRGAQGKVKAWDGDKGVPEFGSRELQELHAEIQFAVDNRESDLDDVYIANRIGAYNQLLRRDQRGFRMTAEAAKVEELLTNTGEALDEKAGQALAIMQEGGFGDLSEEEQEDMQLALAGERRRLERKFAELERRGKLNGEFVLVREQIEAIQATESYLESNAGQTLVGDMAEANPALKRAMELMTDFDASDIERSTASLTRDLNRIKGMLHTLSNQHSTEELNYYLTYQERLEQERKSLQQRDSWAAWSFNGLIKGVKDGNLDTLLDRAADGSLVMSPYQEYGLLHMTSASNHSRYDFTYDDAPEYVQATTLINQQLEDMRGLPENAGLGDNELLEKLHNDWMTGHRQAKQGEAAAEKLNALPRGADSLAGATQLLAGRGLARPGMAEDIRKGIIGHVNKRDRSRGIDYDSGVSVLLDKFVNSDLSDLFEAQFAPRESFGQIQQLPFDLRQSGFAATLRNRLPEHIRQAMGEMVVSEGGLLGGENYELKYKSFAAFADDRPDLAREAIAYLTVNPEFVEQELARQRVNREARGERLTLEAEEALRPGGAEATFNREFAATRLDEANTSMDVRSETRPAGPEGRRMMDDGPLEGARNPQIGEPGRLRVGLSEDMQRQLSDDEIVRRGGASPKPGFAEDLQPQPVTPDQPLDIGSLTRPFKLMQEMDTEPRTAKAKEARGEAEKQMLRQQADRLPPAEVRDQPVTTMRRFAKRSGITTARLNGMLARLRRGQRLTEDQVRDLERYAGAANKWLAGLKANDQEKFMDPGQLEVFRDGLRRVELLMSMDPGYTLRQQRDLMDSEELRLESEAALIDAERKRTKQSLRRQRTEMDVKDREMRTRGGPGGTPRKGPRQGYIED